MAGNNDDADKTEEPTHKKMQDALDKGQVAFSREVTNFLVLLVLALNIIWFAPIYMRDTVLYLRQFIENGYDMTIDSGGVILLFSDVVKHLAWFLIMPIFAMVIVAFAASFIRSGIVISTEPISPKLEKISIAKGLKRLFSMRSMMEFIKGILKISIIGSVTYLAIESDLYKLENLVSYSISGIVSLTSAMAFKMVLAACMLMAVIAFIDFTYQKFEHIKSLKMSKQEIKDEFKQSEGDPHIKAKLRQIRQERAQNRMMQAIPDADVVIRNPTHFAVALKYDDKTMPAPIVIALGQDNIALKIIEIGEENNITIVTNKPLARSLFESSELEQEIPLEHYQAVAEIIGYVYNLRNKNRKL